MPYRKRGIAALILLSGTVSLGAHASEPEAPYPEGPLTLVVGFPPGGATDVLARMLAQHMTEDLGQKVVIENRPGAAGNVAAESVARAAPDGYTLHLTARPNTIDKALYEDIGFDATSDLAPVALLATSHSVIVTGKCGSIGNVHDLIVLAKSYPGALTCASPGVGADGYFLCELLKQETQADIVHVPYRGAAPALVDVIAGRVNVLITSLSSALPQIQSGSVRALAVTSRQRVPIAPQIPTIHECAVPELDLDSWYGITVPGGTSQRVITRLNKSINTALMDPGLRQAFMERAYAVPLQPNTSEEFGRLISEEGKRWTAFLEQHNIKPAS